MFSIFWCDGLIGSRYWQVPYYWVGCKMYDVLAGKENMETSYLMTKGKALEAFPMLKSDGLVGALVYYDGTCPCDVDPGPAG